LSTGFLDTRGDWPDHTHTKATKEALEKRVSELEKTKLALSEELAEEQLNAKTTKTQLENKVNKLRVPTTLLSASPLTRRDHPRAIYKNRSTRRHRPRRHSRPRTRR
jgi:uncharacterized coiled-coil protein SlyX